MGSATKNLMTAEELLQRPDDGRRHELINGEMTSMTPSGSEHSRTTILIGRVLANYIADHNLGWSFGAEGGFVIARDPDTVLAPDFAFVRKSRIATTGSTSGFFPGAPDLAVKVLSPSDRMVDVEDKVQQWLDGGTRQVWVVNLRRRTLTIHAKDERPQVLHTGDRLEGADLLPGFSAQVETLLPAD